MVRLKAALASLVSLGYSYSSSNSSSRSCALQSVQLSRNAWAADLTTQSHRKMLYC